MRTILIATSNAGKLRDFAAAAQDFAIEVVPVPNFSALPAAREDAPTFEANACKKAEHYSRLVKDQYVLADDSGLAVDILHGAPGVLSARYATSTGLGNATDAANNSRLLEEMQHVEDGQRTARFICSIAVARNGRLLACFRGEAEGILLREPRGTGGFGYDPLFYFPSLGKTFAELTPEEKGTISHRGQAFRKFLRWYSKLPEEIPVKGIAPQR